MFAYFRISLIILALASFNIAKAQSIYPLAQAIADAVALSGEVSAARSQQLQAEEGIEQANSYRLPQITGNSEVGSGNIEDDGGNQTNRDGSRYSASLQVDQNIWSFGRNTARLDSARANLRAAEYRLQAAENQVAQQVSLAYAAYVFRADLMVLRQNYVANVQEQLTAIERQLQAGTGKRTDVARVRSQYFQARNDLGLAEAQARAAAGTIQRLTGQNMTSGEWMTSSAGIQNLTGYVPESLEVAVEQALQTSPVVLESLSLLDSVKADADFAKAELYPNIGVRAASSRSRNGDVRTESETIGITASVNLFDGGLTWSRSRQAKEAVNAAASSVKSSKDQVAIRVEQIWASIAGQASGRDDIQNAVNEARSAVEDTRREVQAGSLPIIALTTAEKDLLDIQIVFAENDLQYLQGVISLMQEVGLLTQLDSL